MKKKYFLYLIRWQLSTPILYLVLLLLPMIGIKDKLLITVIANLIGGLIFFWIDLLLIFRKDKDGNNNNSGRERLCS